MVKRFSKFVALATTITMLAAPVSVFAADPTEVTTSPASGSATASGELEGWVDKEVFCVELPTIDEDDTTFQFVLDPQNLIGQTADTNSKQLASGVSSGDGLYFTVTDGLSSTSEALTATNKSSVDVDISVSATLTNYTGVTLSSDKDLSGDADKNSIYLALVASGEAVSSNALANGTATYEGTLASADAAYAVTLDNGEYGYTLDENYAGEFDSVDFYLTGKCNQNADVDWSSLTDIAPTVTVKWTLSAASTGYLSAKSVSATSNTVNVTLPDGVTLKSLSSSNKAVTMKAGSQYTYKNNVLTFTTAFCTNQAGTTVTVTFSDGTTETLAVQ
jgi:hypothetical protein